MPAPNAPTYLGGGYVGSVPGVGLQVDIESSSVPWVMIVAWTDEPFSGTDGIYSTPPADSPSIVEVYAGDTACSIVDNLPVLLPFVSFYAGPWSSGTVTVTGAAWTSPSNSRGPMALPSTDGISVPSGYLIAETEVSVPAGQTQTFYSPILAPGPHQLYLEADVASPSDEAFAQFEISYDNIEQLILAQATQNLAGIKQFQGQVLLPNVQPRITFINDTMAAVSFAGQLARPPGPA